MTEYVCMVPFEPCGSPGNIVPRLVSFVAASAAGSPPRTACSGRLRGREFFPARLTPRSARGHMMREGDAAAEAAATNRARRRARHPAVVDTLRAAPRMNYEPFIE